MFTIFIFIFSILTIFSIVLFLLYYNYSMQKISYLLLILTFYILICLSGGIYYNIDFYKILLYFAPIFSIFIYSTIIKEGTLLVKDTFIIKDRKKDYLLWIILLPMFIILYIFTKKFITIPHIDAYWFVDSALNDLYSLKFEMRWIFQIFFIKNLSVYFSNPYIIYIPSLILFIIFYCSIIFSYKKWLLGIKEWWLLFLILSLSVFPLQIYLILMVRDYIDSQLIFLIIGIITILGIHRKSYYYLLFSLLIAIINLYFNPRDLVFSFYAIFFIIYIIYRNLNFKKKNIIFFNIFIVIILIGLNFIGFHEAITTIKNLWTADGIISFRKEFLDLFWQNSYIRFIFLDANQPWSWNIWLNIIWFIIIWAAFLIWLHKLLFRHKDLNLLDYFVMYNVFFIFFLQFTFVWVQWARMMRYSFLSNIFLLIVILGYIYNIFSSIDNKIIKRICLTIMFIFFINPYLYYKFYQFDWWWSPFYEYSSNWVQLLSSIQPWSIVIDWNQWPKYLYDDFRKLWILKNDFKTINLPQEVLKNGSAEYPGNNIDREQIFFDTIDTYKNSNKEIYFFVESYSMWLLDCNLVIPCKVQEYIYKHFTLYDQINDSLLFKYSK